MTKSESGKPNEYKLPRALVRSEQTTKERNYAIEPNETE